MKDLTSIEREERRSEIYSVITLLLIGALVPLIYLVPAWIILIGYILGFCSIFIIELIVDHPPHRSQPPDRQTDSKSAVPTGQSINKKA